jgi:hypothetical protein
MKKLLYTLLAVTIIFSACEEEDSQPDSNNNNSASVCGAVSMEIDGVAKNYNPIDSDLCYSGNMVSSLNGNILSIGIAFQSLCSSNTANDYSVVVQQVSVNCSINDLVGLSLPILDARYQNFNCQTFPSTFSYLTGNSVGQLIITNFDYSVNPATISGSFSINIPAKPEINCTFIDVPCSFINM